MSICTILVQFLFNIYQIPLETVVYGMHGSSLGRLSVRGAAGGSSGRREEWHNGSAATALLDQMTTCKLRSEVWSGIPPTTANIVLAGYGVSLLGKPLA